MIRPSAWDGTAEQFWDALEKHRRCQEAEGELAVLMDVLTLARAYEGLRAVQEQSQEER